VGVRRWLLGYGSGGEVLGVDSEVLASHGFVAGMTGSGKTGLLVVLAEGARESGVATLLVDVKGDLAPAVEQLGARVYTPGLGAGNPVSISSLFQPSGLGAVDSAYSLLSLTGGEVVGAEAGLVASLLQYAWSRGWDVDLGVLARMLLYPPLLSVGGVDVDSLVPRARRRELALKLVSSLPRIGDWLAGDPLDLGSMLRSSSVLAFYLAHLSQPERMMFTSLLLREVRRWMVGQGSSQGLRLLVLFDEVFGYIPPHPYNPPSKEPLLAIIKQGRAYGVSVFLATQNPVDVDYKALGNARLWLVGRLQTRNDVDRVLDGISQATGGRPRELRGTIMSLKPREFLLYDAWAGTAEVFRTRDCRVALKGPAPVDSLLKKAAGVGEPWAQPRTDLLELPPETPGLTQRFAQLTPLPAPRPRGGGTPRYKPYLLASALASFESEGEERTIEVYAVAPLSGVGEIRFQREVQPGLPAETLTRVAGEAPDYRLRFEPPNPALLSPESLRSAQSLLKRYAVEEAAVELYYCPRTRLYSVPGESLESFNYRRAQLLAKEAAKRLARLTREVEKTQAQLDALKVRLAAEGFASALQGRAPRWLSIRAARLITLQAKLDKLRREEAGIRAELARVASTYGVQVVKAKPRSVAPQSMQLVWVPYPWGSGE
ncbi:MAG: helicase HerA-like domain-containing protein, partial [Infirmifilum sp.]